MSSDESFQHVDVTVIGAGIMGAAAAWQLARRGLRVAVVEQYSIPHTRGSSHGASRIFRLAYEYPEYVALARESLQGWHELEERSGHQLLMPTGGVDFGPAVHLDPIANALNHESVRFERLSSDMVSLEFPSYRVPCGWEALVQVDAGVLLADTCWRTLLDFAQEHGVAIHSESRVLEIRPDCDRVTITTNRGTFESERVVVATAGWSNHLLTSLGIEIPLRTTREHVAYYSIQPGAKYLPFIWHGESSAPEMYGLPNGQSGTVKVGEHGTGPITDPDDAGRLQVELLKRVSAFVEAHLPGLTPRPVEMQTCLYATSRDDNFVIDRVGSVVLCAGFGGHGFKFAPKIGEMVARLVTDDAEGPMPRFAFARFAQDALLS